MHHDRPRVGVGQQVLQFLGDVAVVDVQRPDPGLERPEHRLEVLVAVVQVDRQVVLPALVVGELGPFDVAAEPATEQVVRQPPGAFGDVGPGQPDVAEHETFRVGTRVADRLEDFGKAEFGDG